MTPRFDLADAVVAAWKTNNRVTVFLFENLPHARDGAGEPDAPRVMRCR